jgi:hypothetical protein
MFRRNNRRSKPTRIRTPSSRNDPPQPANPRDKQELNQLILDGLCATLSSPAVSENLCELLWKAPSTDGGRFWISTLKNPVLSDGSQIQKFIHSSFYALNGSVKEAESWIYHMGHVNAPQMARIIARIIDFQYDVVDHKLYSTLPSQPASFQSCLVSFAILLTHTR